uniref:Attractin/MKLN-like beta-propeller domain-containing protein n=1 Tax=Alexandrium monilatum TaxID=311494 RepID=A0A7S4UN90_9DINO
MMQQDDQRSAAPHVEAAEDDVKMLKLWLAEQAAQVKILSDLGHYLVQAHFAFRERHFDLSEQHQTLVGVLCRKGLVSDQDFDTQARSDRQTNLLCCLCSEPQIASSLMLYSGAAGARCLLLSSHRFATALTFALEQLEEDVSNAPANADADELSEDAPPGADADEHCEERSAPSSARSEGWASAQWGFLTLLQEIWQYNTLTESISRAMGMAAFQQFRAVSRAGRECMRSVHSRMGDPHPLSDSSPSGTMCSSACLPMAKPKGIAPPLETPAEEGEPMSQTLALLHHLWQDMALNETLKSCMGIASVQAFRGVSRGGCECMRPSKWRRSSVEAAAQPAERLQLQVGGSSSSQEGRRYPSRKSKVQASKDFTHIQSKVEGGLPQQRLVRLCNLAARADLNGVVAKVVQAGRMASGRWTVVLPTGESIRVRPQNIEPLPVASPQSAERRELKCDPMGLPADVAVEERVLGNPRLTREIANRLGIPSIYCLATMSPRVRDALMLTGKIYVCGGVDSSTVLGTVECYDLHAGKWVRPQPKRMRRPRGGAAFCVSGGRFWCAGGAHYGAGWLNSLERFDPWSGEWEVMPPMKTARIYASMVAIEGFLYVCGGHTQHNVPVAAVERFDPKSRTWKEIPSMLHRRTVPMTAVMHGQLLAFGGVDTGYLSSIECYSPCSEFWQRLPPMAFCRSYSGVTTAKGYLYLCGGSGHAVDDRSLQPKDLDSCERYSIRRKCWEQLPKMQASRSACFAVVRDDILFVNSGCQAGRPSVEGLDLVRMTCWEAVGPPMVQECTSGVTLTVAEHIYVLGGRSLRQTSQDLLSTVVRYSLSGHVWEELPCMEEARTFAAGFHCIL